MKLAEIINKKAGESVKKKSLAKTIKRKDVEIVMGADRIGEKTALLLLGEFKTPEKVFTASRKDLLKVKGVGDSTVSDLKKWKQVYYEGV